MATTVVPDLGEQLRPFLQALPADVRPRLLARLERGAGDRYRAWAASCPDRARAEGLRGCAAREDEVAMRVEQVFAAAPDEERHVGSVLPAIAEVYAAALDGRPLDEQYTIQAASERRGAALWRSLAASSPEPVRAALLVCATLEEGSAEFLESLVRGRDG